MEHKEGTAGQSKSLSLSLSPSLWSLFTTLPLCFHPFLFFTLLQVSQGLCVKSSKA